MLSNDFYGELSRNTKLKKIPANIEPQIEQEWAGTPRNSLLKRIVTNNARNVNRLPFHLRSHAPNMAKILLRLARKNAPQTGKPPLVE